MTQKPVTLIVSDLHMGSGQAGDDFVHQGSQFSRFLREQEQTAQGQRGNLELIINGDFLELAQVNADAYSLGSPTYWCSEAESLLKLSVILDGHGGIFQQLGAFQATGNRVTVMAGNHDVDLYWSRVQQTLRAAAGPVHFELGDVWYSRYEGRLRISHGHMLDPANRFKNWSNPVLLDDTGVMRLEMCPGTLFVVKFVNWLENEYPFADNLHPVTKLTDILAKEDRFGLVTVAWMLSRFAIRHPGAALGTKRKSVVGPRLRQMIAVDPEFLAAITKLYQQIHGSRNATPKVVRSLLSTERAVSDFICELLPKLPPEEWLPVFDRAKPVTLATGRKSGATLAVYKGRIELDKECRTEARKQWKSGAEIVVLGHTHLPEQMSSGTQQYFNPGSWTRYVDAKRAASLTMEDLRNEYQFPYELNYVRVEAPRTGSVHGEMICYEKQKVAQ